MLYSGNQIALPTGIFRGRVQESVFDWKTNLPSLDTQQFFSLAGYQAILDSSGGQGASFFRAAAKASTFQGLRNCMGYVAQAYGYYQKARGVLEQVFRSPLSELIKDTANLVMDQLELAVNSISWVPVVGWIIKALYMIADLIFSVVKLVRKKQAQRETKALNALALKSWLPFANPNPDADTIMGQALQKAILGANLEWMITPQHLATSAGDFQARIQRAGDGSGICTDGYLIGGKSDGNTGGLGFMPGSMNIHSAMELSTRGANIPVKDLGAYLPATQSMAAAIWSQTVKGDSGIIFAVDTGAIAGMWSDYARAAVEFAHDDMSRGWSMIRGPLSSGPVSQATKYQCTFKCSPDIPGCTRKKDRGKWRDIPGQGHTNTFVSYLHELFQWTGETDPDKVNWDDIATTRALDNLRDRQSAMLNSITCMYLDDADISGGPQRFQAIRRGGAMNRQWQSNVQALFEAGEWTRVNYLDVIPGGEVDRAIQDRLGAQGTTVESFFNLNAPRQADRGVKSLEYSSAQGRTVLGDPAPPPPGETVDFEPIRRVSRIGPKPSSSGLGAAPLALAGAAAIFLALRK